MKLYLIRHGEMAGDAHRQYDASKHLSDCLSPLGCAEADQMADALSAVPFDRIFSSPLGRAIQTAQPLASCTNNEIEVLPWAMEWRPAPELIAGDNAKYEEMMQRVSKKYPEETWKTELGEGALEMAHRVITGFVSWMSDIGVHARHGGYVMDDPDDSRNIALVAHGGSLGRLASFLLGIPTYPLCPISMAHTGVAVFEFTRHIDVWHPYLKLSAPYSHETLQVTQTTTNDVS
ncbi:histidine phosphatase family protein [Poriferisphaera sp. WC338]|uniref:histidine phosphatase family protein n=1 Tax=Poriferisphaera sp. WC338 TaxID=3425129 RepID=UPI003D817603